MQFTAQQIKDNQNRYTADGYCPEGARLLKIVHEENLSLYQDWENLDKHLGTCSQCRIADEPSLPEPKEVK